MTSKPDDNLFRDLFPSVRDAIWFNLGQRPPAEGWQRVQMEMAGVLAGVNGRGEAVEAAE
ncbi:hypothetical protein [Sphaerotilus microaerophilus]|uniref:hypothetical protein n=1 Tax=Sphaerotilus microaerophilus TaxID=2914710 RepID=UPI002073D3A7|nr:hypothetical protein [Sphaerotilus sp. FB-5]